MSDKLKDLYQEVILKHNSAPLNFEKRDNAMHSIEAYNPVCGDQFHIYLDVAKNSITELSFHGYGCAISKSSASVLTQLLKHKTIDYAIQINEVFKNVLLNNGVEDRLPKELLAFTPVKQHPGRIKCVTLCWDSLIDFLKTIK